MNDYEYTFKQDVKEKKSIGRNAKYMNRTGKGPMRFPSDYLTNKEKKKLNGSVNKYDMGKPITWQAFKAMPEDLQKMYLQGVIDKFHPSAERLGELFGKTGSTIKYWLDKLGVKPAGVRGGNTKISGFDVSVWEAWIADNVIPEDPKEPVIKESKFQTYLSELEKEENECLEISEFLETPDVSDNLPLGHIANMWSTYISHKLLPLKAEDVAAMFAMIKLADITTGKATKNDWRQLAVYANYISECPTINPNQPKEVIKR